MLVVSSKYRRAWNHPRSIVTPLQSEYSWFLRLVDARRKQVARCPLESWTGEFDGVHPAPDGSLAGVRWNDQTEAGLILVAMGDRLEQLPPEWDTRRTNWLEGPTWTPDSAVLVLAENPTGAGPWWAEHVLGEADDSDPSPGGTFQVGSLVVLDRELHERSRRRIDVELPSGWFPSSDADRGLGQPVAISPTEVTVRVPTRGDQRFEVDSSRGAERRRGSDAGESV
jgi:hypothetical protein